MYNLILRTQELIRDQESFCDWWIKEEKFELNPENTAILIVDMWDRHWSKGATARCAAMAPKMDSAIRRARDEGSLIVHAPSDTMDFYKDYAARKRLLYSPVLDHIPAKKVNVYPLPVDASDGGSDTVQDDPVNTIVWTRQTEEIFIDEEKDIIGGENDGDLIYSYLMSQNINTIIYMGVHTNMCILDRPFSIKAMLRRGMNVMLCRDMTDAMYNPERPPYVSHEEGTRLIIEHIEKFYCPTILSEQIA